MTEIPELLPFPDVSTLDFVARCREGIQRLIALDDDERHVLQDNLDNGSVGETIKHPEPPSRGYILAWNKIVGFIQGKVDRMKAEHEFFQNMGKLGQQVKQAKKAAHEAEGGLKGGFSGGEANSNHNSNQNNKNNEYEGESTSVRPKLESSSYSYSQPNDDQDVPLPLPLPKPLPNSVKEVMDAANAKGWNVSDPEASEWFYTNIENNKGHHGKTGQPFDNWLGAFHNHLLKQRETTVDNIWGERVHAFKSEDNANTFGDDAELDERLYEAAKQVLCLNLHSRNPKENQRLAILKQNMSNICRQYETVWGR